ncbi:hypothetical protein BC826DRAFT_642863 [Russula brevipes]|nr:hypothetical protein BC826DRAFT_642863 [Russula brevipes]
MKNRNSREVRETWCPRERLTSPSIPSIKFLSSSVVKSFSRPPSSLIPFASFRSLPLFLAFSLAPSFSLVLALIGDPFACALVAVTPGSALLYLLVFILLSYLGLSFFPNSPAPSCASQVHPQARAQNGGTTCAVFFVVRAASLPLRRNIHSLPFRSTLFIHYWP